MHTLAASFFAIIFTFAGHTQTAHHSTAFVPPSEYANNLDYNIPSHHDILNGYGTTVTRNN